MATAQFLEVPVEGMDCADCTRHVQHAIQSLPGVESVRVFLASEKAEVVYDPAQVDLSMIQKAVAAAGYRVPDAGQKQAGLRDVSRPVLTLFGIVFGAVLSVVVLGEWLGLFEKVTGWIPWLAGWALVLLFGYPVFKNVLVAAWHRQIISHTLMSLGVIAALAVGEWPTAVVVVFFMRVGDYVEAFTTGKARQAVREVTGMMPVTARVEREGAEVEAPLNEVRAGDVVVVRPGEKIPVDGEVIEGQATIQQAAITGESMPVEAAPGSRVYAATIAALGSLRVRTLSVGADTTFGKVIRLVEEAEANQAEIQHTGDRFAGYYLPVVAGIAGLTYLFSRDPLATAAVLLVACSCSFALATPIAMLASIGAAARQGILIKGGRYLELLAKADTLLIDKTGTLTLGQPAVTDVVTLNGLVEDELLALAAAAEAYSEHPLGAAVRRLAVERGLRAARPERFAALPGRGVRAEIDGQVVEVGSQRILEGRDHPAQGAALQAEGKTLLYLKVNGDLAGVLAAADTLRAEAPGALEAARQAGIRHIELLTGDNEATAAAIAGQLGIDYRAGLLPEDKIRIVQAYQRQGRVVVMVGDGVNDAPALAQAQVGIAMGAGGSDVAVEAAHIALMKDDWRQLPQVIHIARRTMRTVRMNLGFTMLYNLVGLTLAALGPLPPILAAAAQSLPDLGILGNSSRLLGQKVKRTA